MLFNLILYTVASSSEAVVVIGEQGEGQRHWHGEAAAGEGWRCVTLVLLAETHVTVPAINNSVVSKHTDHQF